MASTTTTPNAKLPDIQAEHADDFREEKEVTIHNAAGKIFSIDDNQLPDGYFKTPQFWGSMIAIGLSVSCGVAGFSFIAPLLAFVNADIGPSNDLNWVALTYTLTGAVGLMIVGRLTGMTTSYY
jgi:hypothetical protein